MTLGLHSERATLAWSTPLARGGDDVTGKQQDHDGN